MKPVLEGVSRPIGKTGPLFSRFRYPSPPSSFEPIVPAYTPATTRPPR